MSAYKYLFIGLFCWLSLSTKAADHLYDSLRMEVKNGQSFIVHKVEPKETLFSISRRYNIQVNDILNANVGLENGLKMYQELFVPYSEIPETKSPTSNTIKDGLIHIVEQGETMYSISKKYKVSIERLKELNSLSDFNIGLGDSLLIEYKIVQEEIDIDSIPSTETSNIDSSYHVVAISETLYSISLLHKIDIEDLKNWNNLTSNALDIGQKLIIKKGPSDTLDIVKIEPKQPIDTLYVKTDTTRFRTKIEKTGSINKTTEEGFATKIERTEETRKYLLLHRSAPIGTVIEVKNQMNSISIFARVVGKLPETGLNRNVLIRLSHAAYEKLGALDAKIPVEIGYVIE